MDLNRDGIPDVLQRPPMVAPTVVPAPAFVPAATAAIDANGDGRANYFVSGMDLNRDGIPDVLQRPPMIAPAVTLPAPSVVLPVPSATAAVDATGNGFANYIVSGADLNR